MHITRVRISQRHLNPFVAQLNAHHEHLFSGRHDRGFALRRPAGYRESPAASCSVPFSP